MGLPAILAAVVAMALVAPAVALADNCHSSSAVCIYSESSMGAAGDNTIGGAGQKPVKVSKHVAGVISRAHKHQKVLNQLVTSPAFSVRHIQSVPADAVKTPSALNAVFDIGAGPLALIAVLGGTAVLLLAGLGWRGWRRWRGGLAA